MLKENLDTEGYLVWESWQCMRKGGGGNDRLVLREREICWEVMGMEIIMINKPIR